MDLVDTEQVDQKQLLTLAKGIVISGGAYIVLGPSGSGKTYIFHQACSKAKVRPIMVNLSVLERPDFMGMPFRERGRQRWATPSFIPLQDDEDGVLILDEIDKAPEDLQAPLLELIQFRTINGLKTNVKAILATGNLPDEGTYSNLLSKALTGRCLIHELKPIFSHWANWMTESKKNPLPVAFLSNSQYDFWHKPRKEETAYPQCSPRKWTMVSDLLDWAGKIGGEYDTIDHKHLLVSGLVGSEAASSFKNWLIYYKELDDPINKLVFDGVMPSPSIVDSLDKKWVMVLSITQKLTQFMEDKTSIEDFKKRAANIFSYLRDMDEDITYGAMKAARHHVSEFYTKYDLFEDENFSAVWTRINEVAA